MSVAPAPLPLQSTFARELAGLHVPWQGRPVRAPRLLAFNEELAREIGLDPHALTGPEGVAVLAGNAVPEGATPVAQAYAGHQFGGWSPRLGDGRALLLGELPDGRDLHLKGSGRTPFARGGDGRAAVGPMLREYVMGEAMHALGIPTSRALAVVATGEEVPRETLLPGAVLARVAASHLRVGTFQYASAGGDRDLLRRLLDYAIARHHPGADGALGFYDAVLEAQARLVAQWMLVGFIHGVMNTDNMTISGETIDFGPCAFLEAYDPATVFSSIDHAGRYAYGNQPSVAAWNLARLAEALLPLVDEDTDRAVAAVTGVLQTFPDRYATHWRAGMRAKLGLADAQDGDVALIDDLLALLPGRDWTATFVALGAGEVPEGLEAWAARWRRRSPSTARMAEVNPVYIPRNHLVEEALEAATAGDLAPFRRLVEVVSHPYGARPGLARYAAPAPEGFGATYQTFCGT